MEDNKEFQGKTLDEAIECACSFYNCEREKLEIDILEDAKPALLGIFGGRRATISAKKALPLSMQETSKPPREQKENREPRENKPYKNNDSKSSQNTKYSKQKESAPSPKTEKAERQERAEQRAERKESRSENNSDFRAEQKPRSESRQERKFEERAPQKPISELNQEELIKAGLEAITKLVTPLDENMTVTAEVTNERLNFALSTENSGLIIGKEGQTLASIEYIVARILTKFFDYPVRVQIEVGDYRSRQDARLQEFALTLADRTLSSGKSSATRPLSAYQRRIVHSALQDMPNIQTKSTGEGNMKRVIISYVK